MEEKRGRKVGVADRRERQDLVHRLYEAVLATLGQVHGALAQFVTEADYRSALDDSAAGVDRNLALMRAVAARLLPTLALVYDEPDRLAYLTAALAHQMVLFTRVRWSPHAEAAVRFFGESCAFPFAVRAWRKDVWDAFHENDFFAATGSSSLAPYALLAYWTVPLNQLMVQDRLAWPDLLRVVGKNLQYQPSMFAREHSGLARSRHLRRLAFVLFAGSQDQYGRSIPMLKERLVDAFKIPATPLLQAQVFLCLRVMFLRFSVPSMLSFLPVVLTELLDALCTMPLSPNPLDLDALLAACKLIDTMLLLSDSSFLLHDWLFVSNPAHTAPATAFRAFLSRLAVFPFAASASSDAAAAGQAPAAQAQPALLEAAAEDEEDPSVPAKPLIRCTSLLEPGARAQLQALLRQYAVVVHRRKVGARRCDYAALNQLVLLDFAAPAEHAAAPAPAPAPLSAPIEALEAIGQIPTALH